MPHIVLGDPRKPLIVLIAGFPDDFISGWSLKVLNELQADYFLISICFPGFNNHSSSRPWGYDFEELVDMTHETIQNVISRQCLKGAHESYYLLLHDWGSYLGQKYENKYREKVKSVCLLDAGNMKGVKFSIYLFYRYLFGVSYAISQAFGHAMGTFFFRLSLVWLVLFPFIGPTKRERAPKKISEIHVDMCYPFYYTTIRSLLGQGPPTPVTPSCSVLFIYGGRKNIDLHGPYFLGELRKRLDCKVVYLERSGHWPTRDYPAQVLSEVKQFFK